MDFELTADAESIGGLGRLKSLTANRDGRPRSQPVKIVWHDSPEHALLTDGLTLAEQRGVQRLERLVPGAETWLPAQPPPRIAEAPDPAGLPAPLAPLAAFEGRRTSSVHRFNGACVTVTIDKGTLRSVTAERPVARVLISGDEEAVQSCALLIAEAVDATVPPSCLAAEAIALATGRNSAPRHHGPPVLPDSVTQVPDAMAHILGHLTDVILAHAPAAMQQDEASTVAIHQMRVAVRRARSALSVFRPVIDPTALAAVTALLKTLGGHLGPSRDWDVFIHETLPSIQRTLPDNERLERLATAAARRRRDHRTALAAFLGSAGFRRLMIELAWFSAATVWHAPQPEAEPPSSLAGFSAAVLQQRWKKLVSAGKHMEELDIPGLHAVRLRTKRARYAAEMFVTLYGGKAAQRFIHRLSVLQQRLGVLNDGAVATDLLEELGGAGGRHGYAVGVVAGFLAARAEKIRPRIMVAFEKFRRQPTYWA